MKNINSFKYLIGLALPVAMLISCKKDFLEKLRTVTSFKLAENHLLLSGSGTVVFKFQKVD